MISQVIKRWLQKLFAWWPWKSTSETNYAHPVSTINKSAAQDSTMYTTVDGTVSQPGSSPVAVEHIEEEEMFTELAWTKPDERPEPDMPSPTPTAEERSDIPLIPSREQNKQTPGELSTIPTTPTPTAAQKLEFLRYLVQRGLVNEGFDRGYEPEQYRKNL